MKVQYFLQNGGGDDTADQYTKEAKGEGYFDKSIALEKITRKDVPLTKLFHRLRVIQK